MKIPFLDLSQQHGEIRAEMLAAMTRVIDLAGSFLAMSWSSSNRNSPPIVV